MCARKLIGVLTLAGCLAIEPARVVASGDQPYREGDGRASSNPITSVSEESLLGFLGELTSHGAYSGWRTAGSRGEAAAFDYVESTLRSMPYLVALGLETERPTFRIPVGMEMRGSNLYLRVGGEEAEVPADSLLSVTDSLETAMYLDTDGVLNDTDPDPIEVVGPAVVALDAAAIDSLNHAQAAQSIVFVDFELFDTNIRPFAEILERANRLIVAAPLAVVLVTRYSNRLEESHGEGATGASVFSSRPDAPPTLTVQLENLAQLGINHLEDLDLIENARVTLDTDILAPGSSGNLIARIPGEDPTRAIVVSAHLDSYNTPGALDDGSGSVAALEIARVFDELEMQPPIDLYLVWFGSHERGLYGSGNFATTHGELLDRAVAVIQNDCLTAPIDGVEPIVLLQTWGQDRFGESRTPLSDHLRSLGLGFGLATERFSYPYFSSDSASTAAFDVPNAHLIYADPYAGVDVHHAGHLHEPYDTVEVAAREIDTLADMTRLALSAVVHSGHSPDMHVTPTPDRRAVFVASHTEAPHMTPVLFVDLGMALARQGFDVDVVPYDRPVAASDLVGADLVVVLPAFDYPSAEGDPTVYDTAWSDPEVDALTAYVDSGGLLAITNSRYRLKYFNLKYEENEDWADNNSIASRFGVEFREGLVFGGDIRPEPGHPLVEGIDTVFVRHLNSVPFTINDGTVIASSGTDPVIASVLHGGNGGEVLVFGDIGIFGEDFQGPTNMQLYVNLATYARGQR